MTSQRGYIGALGGRGSSKPNASDTSIVSQRLHAGRAQAARLAHSNHRHNKSYALKQTQYMIIIARYCSSHTTALPSRDSRMAMCVIAVRGVAPCQCFKPGGIQTTSLGRTSSKEPPSRCTQPAPSQAPAAVRASGSDVRRLRRPVPARGTRNIGSLRPRECVLLVICRTAASRLGDLHGSILSCAPPLAPQRPTLGRRIRCSVKHVSVSKARAPRVRAACPA